MKRIHGAVMWLVTAGLAAGLAGCSRDPVPDPVAAIPEVAVKEPATVVSPPPAKAPETAAADTAQITELKKRLQIASQEVSRAEAWAEDLKREMAEDQKAADLQEQRLWILQETLMALRDRLRDSGQGDWVIRVQAQDFKTRQDVSVQTNSLAPDGNVLVFDKSTSAIETTLSVGAGYYRVVPVGMAPRPEQDAMMLTIKASRADMGDTNFQQRVCFDKDFDKIEDISRAPTIVVKQPGDLTIGLKTTEEKGMLVDRIELRVTVPK